MKHLKHINEIFGINGHINTLLHKGENSVKEIFKRMDELKSDDITLHLNLDHRALSYEEMMSDFYSFMMDDFSIEIYSNFEYGEDTKFVLKVDGVEIESSRYINKKIYKKCEEIIKKEADDKSKKNRESQKEIEEYVRKDVNLHFKNK